MTLTSYFIAYIFVILLLDLCCPNTLCLFCIWHIILQHHVTPERWVRITLWFLRDVTVLAWRCSRNYIGNWGLWLSITAKVAPLLQPELQAQTLPSSHTYIAGLADTILNIFPYFLPIIPRNSLFFHFLIILGKNYLMPRNL